MKNIHVLPTNKPTRLYKQMETLLLDTISDISEEDEFKNQNIYITSNEEIKEGDWYLYGKEIIQANGLVGFHPTIINACQKIILTDNKDLIKDGVQAIDDEFLAWFVKNPSCEEVEVERNFADEGVNGITYYGKYFLIIPNEEPKQENCNTCGKTIREQMKGCTEISCYRQFLKQETLEEVAEIILLREDLDLSDYDKRHILKAMINIAKWQAERMYSEEEVKKLIIDFLFEKGIGREVKNVEEWFEQFKKY